MPPTCYPPPIVSSNLLDDPSLFTHFLRLCPFLISHATHLSLSFLLFLLVLPLLAPSMPILTTTPLPSCSCPSSTELAWLTYV